MSPKCAGPDYIPMKLSGGLLAMIVAGQFLDEAIGQWRGTPPVRCSEYRASYEWKHDHGKLRNTIVW